MKKIRLGVMDIPKDYFDFTLEQKKDLCENLLEKLYLYIDKRLDNDYNRIEFLREILISSLESNEEDEQYEICQVINDCIKLLDEDRN
jgi:hypothetical protein